MATSAEQIVKTFAQMRTFCRDVALLLRTSDQFFFDQGWKPFGGNYAVAHQSGVLDWPEWWIPRDFFRRYRRDDAPYCEVVVTVICDAFDGTAKPETLTAAIVTVGCIDYRPLPEVEKDNDSSAWRWHLKHPHRRDDGTVCAVEGWTHPWRSSQTIKRFTSLALPLDEIQNSTELSDRLLRPLIDAIAKFQGLGAVLASEIVESRLPEAP
jgi:hypothetical protein